MSRTAKHAFEQADQESDGITLDAAPMSDVIELRPGDRQPVPAGTDRPRVDRFRAEAAARELLGALAVDVTDERTRDTPRRLASCVPRGSGWCSRPSTCACRSAGRRRPDRARSRRRSAAPFGMTRGREASSSH